MKKTILLFVILLLIAAILIYYVSSSRKTSDNLSGTVSPVPTKTQVKEIPENWSTYTSEILGYSISYPEEYSVETNGDFSILILKPTSQPSFGPANFVYVSVVPLGQSTNEGEIYNYNQDHFNKLQELEIEESTSFADSDQPLLNEWFTYTRVDDTEIDGYVAKRFENTKPWEFPSGTTEVRSFFENEGNIYLLGYYYGGEGLTDPIDPREAFEIVTSFNISN